MMNLPSPVRHLRPAVPLALLSAALLGLGLLSVAPAAHADDQSAGSTNGRYYAIEPTRVLATRDIGKPFTQGEVRTVDLSKAFTAPASAVVINLTAAYGTLNSYQTAYPTGTARPYASSLNELRGEVRANSVTVAVGQGGANQNKIDLYNYVGTVQLVVDVVGYYSNGTGAPGVGTSYSPLPSPVRLFDTRKSIGALTSTYPRNIGIVTIDYGSVALNRQIRAVVMNITVTQPVGSGYLALWDGTGPHPVTSSLNYKSGQTTANMAIVPVKCTDDACKTVTFSVYNAVSQSVQVIGDIQGMYAVPGQANSLIYQPVAPTRITDTRYAKPFSQLNTRMTGTTGASTWGTGARAVNMNVTAAMPQLQTYITVWPTGMPQPPTSNVNIQPGNTTPNAVQVKLGAGGSGFQVFNAAGKTTVVIDLAGTFVLDPALSSASSPSSKAAPDGASSADAGSARISGGIA